MFELYSKNDKVLEFSNFDNLNDYKVVSDVKLPFLLRKGYLLNFFDRRCNWYGKKYSADVQMALGISSYEEAVLTTGMTSLNDVYWVKESGNDLTWEDVNLYKNDLNLDIIKLSLFGVDFDSEHRPMFPTMDEGLILTPEVTTGGSYPKAWIRQNDELYLLKRGMLKYNQREIFSEVLSSQISDVLCSNSVKYSQMKYDGFDVSSCKLFTSENVGFVSFQDYIQTNDIRQDVNESQIDFIKRVVSGFDDYHKIDEMLSSDVLMLNDDRHMGNFGFLYDVDDMSILGLAPMFDFNRSLGYSVSDCDLEFFTEHPEWWIKSNFHLKSGLYVKDIVKHCFTSDILTDIKNFEFDFSKVELSRDRQMFVETLVGMQKEILLGSKNYYNNFDSSLSNKDEGVSLDSLEI